jgi:peroxiredoxin family protein
MSAKRLALIASHGSLDAAYPPLILATAAVAMDMDAAIFFTFYGLEILKKGNADRLQVAPIANPAMPQPVKGISVPNILGVLPGMTAVATGMMNGWMKKAKVAKLSELLDMAVEMNVRLIGCQMTMDVMGVKKEDLIDAVEIGGAATLLEYASHDAMTLAF